MKRLILAAVALLAVGSASADVVQFNTTLRDFEQRGIDFEFWNPATQWSDPYFGLKTGMVENTLGADGTPVLIGNGQGTVANATDFYDWYHNTSYHSTANTAVYSIPLDFDVSGNVLTYTNNSFFPLDGEAHVTNGLHNYLFTLEMHNTFTYQGGETFDFTGDDDVWVFINDQLVVDIGGVHEASAASVNLDDLGLSAGNDYNFDFFYAERHTTQSNLMITTSLQLKQDDVPEPGMISLLGFGLLGLAGFSLRKRS